MTPILRRVAAACAAALLLAPAACGRDSDEPAASEPPAATTTEPGDGTTMPTADPAATAPPTTEAPATEPPITEPRTTDPPATEPPATAPPLTAAPVGDVRVNVYWAWTVVDPAAGTPERIGAGARTVRADAPARNALDALFRGPNTVESDIGMLTLIPAGTRVLGIAVDGTTATVDLSGEFEATLGGTLAESMQLAQIVFTITQFDGLDRVKFHIDGEPRDPILTHGFEVGDGLTRGDFAEIRAKIMIETPAPGEQVGNPMIVRGESNTFEATVEFVLTTGGGDGLIVAEGFTTATDGMGRWGTFQIVIDLAAADTYLAGPGSIIAFEHSPLDGTRNDLVEIPIVLPAL